MSGNVIGATDRGTLSGRKGADVCEKGGGQCPSFLQSDAITDLEFKKSIYWSVDVIAAH